MGEERKMNDPASLVALSGSGLLAVGLASAALLKAWHGWLELRRLELGDNDLVPGRASSARADLAQLRARVRRLEAIANGADL
jgi:hypothetical protein